MRRALLPLLPLYAAAVAVKNRAYEQGWTRPRRLRNPVVSIGNLSVGGGGKTPLTIRLAELLRECGIAVDVLSRGYARRSQQVQRVQPSGSAAEFGDEPLLIARSAGVPVYVGASRYAAGALAERELPGPRVHLLDDGFQHRQLARDVDVVTLHRSDFAERLLPAGRLREPLASLSRAHILVLREEDRDLEPQLRSRGIELPVWWVARRLEFPSLELSRPEFPSPEIPNREISTPELPAVRSIVAFCAIARPGEFCSALGSQGFQVAALRSWRDHHAYRQQDILELIRLRERCGAQAFFTTEKDLVRLSADQQQILRQAAPLHAARLVLGLVNEAAAIRELLAMLPRAAQAGAGQSSPQP